MTESTLFVADLHHPQLADDEGSNSGGGIVGEGGSKSDLTPLANMVVILRNVDADAIIDVCVTNASGEYSFPSIPDNTNIQMYVTSFEHQEWTPYSVLTESGTNYEIDFVVDGNEVYPDGMVGLNPIVINTSMFPNPTDGFVAIKGNNINRVSVTDLTGKVVYDKNTASNFVELNIKELPKAMYLVKIESEDGIKIEKLILK